MVMTNAERQQGIDINKLLDAMDGETEINDNNQVDPHQHEQQSEPGRHRSQTPDTNDTGGEDSDGEHTTYVAPKNPVIVQRPDPIEEIQETRNAVSKNRPGRPSKQ